MDEEEKLNIDHFMKFWEGMFDDPKCEMCGSSSWGVEGIQESMTAFIPGTRRISTEASPIIDATLSIVIFSCSNCGNTKGLSRKIVDKWIGDNVKT